MKSDTCREKLKGQREVSRRSDGRQELRSCIRSSLDQTRLVRVDPKGVRTLQNQQSGNLFGQTLS